LADNPVDIYFVMDLSGSMTDLHNTLIEGSVTIAENLKELTTDYRIGFGYYSDKPTAPFSREKWYNADYGRVSAFHHQMSLTNDVTLFRVSSATILGFSDGRIDITDI
jgi:hypothetical protein